MKGYHSSLISSSSPEQLSQSALPNTTVHLPCASSRIINYPPLSHLTRGKLSQAFCLASSQTGKFFQVFTFFQFKKVLCNSSCFQTLIPVMPFSELNDYLAVSPAEMSGWIPNYFSEAKHITHYKPLFNTVCSKYSFQAFPPLSLPIFSISSSYHCMTMSRVSCQLINPKPHLVTV